MYMTLIFVFMIPVHSINNILISINGHYVRIALIKNRKLPQRITNYM